MFKRAFREYESALFWDSLLEMQDHSRYEA